MPEARQLSGAALAEALCDSRSRLLGCALDLDAEAWRPPYGAGVNPLAWELGHVAWFAEYFALRGAHRLPDGSVVAVRPARHAGPDRLFDSAQLAHAERWQAPLPAREAVLGMLQAQLDALLEALAELPENADDARLYPFRLVLFHEDMHAEAIAAMRFALGLPAPAGLVQAPAGVAGELRLAGGLAAIGTPATAAGFAFDNEQPGAEVALGDFAIDRAPLAAGDFLRFVEAGGYERAEFWPGPAGAWLAGCGRLQPAHWRRGAAGWEQRWFDHWLPLERDQPLLQVNAWEAEAYCHWAGRRLPTAAEWEHAARTAAEEFAWGGAWEWTSDAFRPYPGFRSGLYAEYSAPWFESHRELRGASFATSPRLRDPRYRNFFRPHRVDVFAGFRTLRG